MKGRTPKKGKKATPKLKLVDITLVGCNDRQAFVGRVDMDSCNSCFLTGNSGTKTDPVYVFDNDVNSEVCLSKSAIVSLYKAVMGEKATK